MQDNSKKIIVVIDRIEENTAYLQFADGMSILWPKAKLPASVQEGDVLSVTVRQEQEIKKKRIKKIKKMLDAGSKEVRSKEARSKRLEVKSVKKNFVRKQVILLVSGR